MIFSEKLQLIRKSRGLTQEELAEKLHVSRQAIAKWESGQTYPDINNLIAVSTIFGLTVDYLVKDNECEKELKLLDKGSEAALIDFLVQAKKQTYAAKKGKVASSRPMSQDYLYDSDDYLYIDTYLGNSAFSGEEAVWYKSQPIYSMNYQGRVLSESFSSDFLKAALLSVSAKFPYRGPTFYQNGDYLYNCKVTGSIDWFQGYEEILYRSEAVYECFFHGGTLK